MNTSPTVKKKKKVGLSSGDGISKVPVRKTVKHANDDIPVKRRARSLVIGGTTPKRNPVIEEIEHEREKRLKAKSKLKGERREIARDLVLPKKIKKDNLPAIFEKPATQRISKLNPSKMKSILGDAAEQINQLMEADANESAQSLMLKRLAQTTLDMIPFAEHTIRKSKGRFGVYQYNSLLTSIREIMIDMQSSRDKGALGDALIEKILRPVFFDIAMVLMREDQQLGNVIKAAVSAEAYKHIEANKQASLVRISEYIQKKFEETKRDTVSFLQQ
jgi:hypothetical protein